MKEIATLSVLVAGIIFLTGCDQKSDVQKPDSKTQPVQTQNLINAPANTGTAGQAAPIVSPEQTVINFYTWFVGMQNKIDQDIAKTGKSSIDDIDAEVLKSSYIDSANISEVAAAMDTEPGVHTLVSSRTNVMCAQDAPAGSAVITDKAFIDGKLASVNVTKIGNFKVKIKIELKNINNEWKIEKVNCLE